MPASTVMVSRDVDDPVRPRYRCWPARDCRPNRAWFARRAGKGLPSARAAAYHIRQLRHGGRRDTGIGPTSSIVRESLGFRSAKPLARRKRGMNPPRLRASANHSPPTTTKPSAYRTPVAPPRHHQLRVVFTGRRRSSCLFRGRRGRSGRYRACDRRACDHLLNCESTDVVRSQFSRTAKVFDRQVGDVACSSACRGRVTSTRLLRLVALEEPQRRQHGST